MRKRDIPEHKIWDAMIQRCTNPKNPQFKNYGSRGIEVCPMWRTFENFYSDMGPRPAGLELERKDNNKGYSPDNCIWATRKQQTNNTRRNVLLTHKGKTQTVAMWADELGIKANTIICRIRRGWSAECALSDDTKKTSGPNRRKNAEKRLSRKRNCNVCGKGFIPRAYQVKTGAGKLCSNRCTLIHAVNSRKDLRLETIINRIERGILK